MIPKVEIIIDGAALVDCVPVISLLISVITIAMLIYDRVHQYRSGKMSLIISPRAKVYDLEAEAFFLNMVFTNESSLPISILDLKIKNMSPGTIPNTSSGNIGGDAHTHFSSKTGGEDGISPAMLPITIKPFDSFGGYIAFHAGSYSSQILSHQNFMLTVKTSRKTFKIEMIMSCDNYCDFSYKYKDKCFGCGKVTVLS